MNKDAALLIPVYNKLKYTQKCLEDLRKQDEGRLFNWLQVIVIDDGSKDGTEEWIKANFPEVVVLKGDGNLFWTGAMNLGMDHAFSVLKFTYIVLWNNDVITEDNYFKQLRDLIQRQPKGMVGSKILTLLDKAIVWSFGGYFDPETGKKGMLGYFEPDGPEYSKEKEVDWCTGMGTLIHRDVMAKIGMMDAKNFPQYFGDMDYSYRAKLAGLPVTISPDLIMYNDTVNTGIRVEKGLSSLIRSLTDIRSNLNLKCNYTFVAKYSTSKKAYITMTMFYVRVVGGFFKWKVLSLLGKTRKQERFYQENK